MRMMRTAGVVALTCGAALLAGCAEDLSIGAGPDGPEWAMALGGHPELGMTGAGFHGEMPIRDPSGREQTIGIGISPRAEGERQAYGDPWREGHYKYCEDVRVCYRRYFGPVGVGPRRTRVFWEAGLTFGTECDAEYDPIEGLHWETGDGGGLLIGGGVRWYMSSDGGKLPLFMEFSVDAFLGDVETPAALGFLFGFSFGAGAASGAAVSEADARDEPARPSLLERWREAREQARAEALARREESKRLQEEARLEALERQQQARQKAAERRAEWWANIRKGVLGMRAGMMLPASGEGADFGQSMTLGLSYRYLTPLAPSLSHELTVDFGWPEEIGGYESRPVVGAFHVLLDVGDPTRQVRGRFVGGLGVMVESAKEEATGDDYTSYAAVVDLGAGAVFAGGSMDARLTYSFFPGSENLFGRACFSVTHSF